MSLTACGDDPASSNNTQTSNNGNADAGPDAVEDDADDNPDADAGQDAGTDGGSDGGNDGGTEPTYTPGEFYQVTSGGGSTQGGGYNAVVGIGAPIPRGSMQGGGYRVQLGPVSP
jgi:hypothetical protein